MRIVVTGGTGFVGSNLVSAALTEGHDVVVFDQREPADGSAEYAAGNLLSLGDLERATCGADVICHLAGAGDVYLAAEEPWTAAASNVVGTANVMEAARRNGVRKVVYASTWEVYGKPEYEPLDERHPTRPDHPYNVTKLAGEQLALTYEALKGVPCVALRLGTAYGPNMRPNSVFSLFSTRALAGSPITIKGTGEQSRQFTHTRDIARAFLLAAASDLHGVAVNIVAHESVSIRRLAELILAEIPGTLTFEPARQGDIHPARVSSELAERLLGWRAEVPFEQGLRELIALHRAAASGPAAKAELVAIG